MSPTRRRIAAFVHVLIAALATTAIAVYIAVTDGGNTTRLLLASLGAACFVGIAGHGFWTLRRDHPAGE